jgi:hypothetical protein
MPSGGTVPVDERVWTSQLPSAMIAKSGFLCAAIAQISEVIAMHLRYSESDEKFRVEFRSWFENAVPKQDEPTPPYERLARHACDAGALFLMQAVTDGGTGTGETQ